MNHDNLVEAALKMGVWRWGKNSKAKKEEKRKFSMI